MYANEGNYYGLVHKKKLRSEAHKFYCNLNGNVGNDRYGEQ